MNQTHESHHFLDRNVSIAAFGCALSLLYLVDIVLRARDKCFWVDELVTLYLCRLASYSEINAAISHGVDFNPPIFYMLTRASERLFGEGPIATRLPEIIGFYLFCVCLYLFTSRRLGRAPGLIAAIFPYFTLVQYYAYEARPHALTLGWCGLSIVCWQRSKEPKYARVYLSALYLSLLGAMLTHVYAVFFLLALAVSECFEVLRLGRIDWATWLTGILAAATAFLGVLPLLRSYTSNQGSHSRTPTGLGMVQPFFVSLIGPSIVLIVLAIIFPAVSLLSPAIGKTWKSLRMKSFEVVFACVLVGLPVLGILSTRVSHSPVFLRYFLVSVGGYAIMIASICGANGRSSRALLYCLSGLVCLTFLHDMRIHFLHLELITIEPTS